MAVVAAARQRVIAHGLVTPERIADWTLDVPSEEPTRNRVCEGMLRGNRPVEVDRLLEVTDWLDKALRRVPEAEMDASIAAWRA